METEPREDLLQIRTYPDPILRQSAAPVKNVDAEVLRLIDDMLGCMYAAPGIGLAANQVGVPRRVIVFDRHPGESGRTPYALINPQIIHAEGEIVREEACLSVVDFAAEVTRSAQVTVRGIDRHGKELELDAEGLLAVCLQHEIDHLNGVLFIDHISSLKRSLYKKKLKKRIKRT